MGKKIIRLTEQDLHRIVKRVIAESITPKPILDCFTSNLGFSDAIKLAGFFIKCESCRRVVYKTGLQVLMSGKTPSPQNVLAILMSDPEIKSLAPKCANEMIDYYTELSPQEQTELRSKIFNIISCVASKVLGGIITPMDLPIPDDIDFPIPGQFPPNSGNMGDMINKGIKTATDAFKNLPLPGQPTGQFPKW